MTHITYGKVVATQLLEIGRRLSKSEPSAGRLIFQNYCCERFSKQEWVDRQGSYWYHCTDLKALGADVHRVYLVCGV